MRILALGGLLGPIVLAVVTILCAGLRSDYSHIHNFISELGATNTTDAGLMNYGGFVPTGLLLAGFGVSLVATVPRDRLSTIGALLVTFFGVGVLASGFFSCDVGCPQAGSIQNLVHNRIAPLAFAAAGFGAVLLGIRFRRLPALRPLWAYSVASGVLGFCLLGGLASTLENQAFTGLWQRLLLLVLFAWCGVVGLFVFRRGSILSSAA